YGAEESLSYAPSVRKASAALANMEQSGMSPAAVAEIIYEILIADKPPVIKTCGAKNTVMRFFTRVAPEKVTLKINERMFHQ
ncbi:MAG: hypothetical protein K2K80_07300, partial [Clostridia bacterium]|nr:hypothetical protein [Clostridia bacterium]